ncbi:hypothetical protein [Arthrobacter sp.]|uniref:hypothetical protein n=1 Tax=Arthrobacter sp. TaxID=1667 RepID=UPI003A92494D
MEHMETVWQLDPGRAPGTSQEVVVLTSIETASRFEAEAVRTWVSDLEGTGLEADITDPVEILSEVATGNLAGFHSRATAEVMHRMESDYEVADLFCSDEALGLG